MRANHQIKRQRLQEVGAGIHLVIVSDLTLLKNPDKTPVDHNGTNYIAIKFTDDKGKIHEQHYPINSEKQKFFNRLMTDIGIDNSKPVSKKEAINRRLYIAIKEVMFLDDDALMVGNDGLPLKEMFVFRTFPFIEGSNKPAIIGDPAKNNGIATEGFVDYRRLESFEQESKEQVEQTSPMSEQTPNF